MKGKYIGLSGKAWIGILALGVVIYIYVKRRAAATSPAAPTADSTVGNDPTDQAQLAAGLGGTPGSDTGGFDPGWLQSTLDAQTQSLEDFIASSGGLAGSGISGAGGAGTSGAGVGAAAPSSAGAAAPATAASPDPNAPTDVANPATSFYAPGTMPAGGASPLYAYGPGGVLQAESPIAGSVFGSGPAAGGYAALGVDPSGPITFLPVPMGPTDTYTGSLTSSGGYKPFTQAPKPGAGVAV